jgi:hypothetical protein
MVLGSFAVIAGRLFMQGAGIVGMEHGVYS